jgi:hypothetical protein
MMADSYCPDTAGAFRPPIKGHNRGARWQP